MKDDDDQSLPSADEADGANEEQGLWDELEAEDRADDGQDDDGQDDDTDHAFEDQPEPDDGDQPQKETDQKPAMPSLEEIQAQNERLMKQLQSEKGRAKGQQSRADALQKQIEQLQARMAAAPSESETERRERLQRTAEEYGDVVNPMLEEMDALRARLDQLSEGEQARLADLKAQADDLSQREYDKFLAVHPDGLEFIQTRPAQFQTWIEDQPKAVRDAFAANNDRWENGDAAAWVMGLFKEHVLSNGQGGSASNQSRSGSRRSRQLAGAQTMRGSQTRQTTTSAPPADYEDPNAHWDYFERLDKRKGA